MIRTYVKVTYVAQVYNKPIVSAHTFKDLEKGLDEYYGIGKDLTVKKIGFTPYNTKYPDDLEGWFEYEVNDLAGGTETEKVNVFCIEFHPHTTYEMGVNEQQSPKEKFKVGDILISDHFKDCMNVPYIFRTHKVDEDYGVVYYKYKDREDTIGFSNVRKANLLERTFGWLMN